ncbi:CHASE3 domain-containing protein [Rhodoferax lacus]|nr:cache domain-containing protein [Rhodoferax lacus]
MNPVRWWVFLAATFAALPFLIFAASSFGEMARTRRVDIEREMVERAYASAALVEQRLSVSAATLKVLAESEAAQAGDIPRLYALAKRVASGLPEVSAISLVSAQGKVLFFTLLPYGSPAFAVNDSDALERVFATGKPVASEPFPSPANGHSVTSVAVPVYQHGKMVYALRMIIPSATLSALLATQHLPVDWTVGILSRTGLLQGRSRSGEAYVGKPASDAVMAAFRNGRKGIFDSINKEGEATKAVIVPLVDWDWHVVLGVPAAQFKAEVVSVATLGLSLVFAALAFGALLVLALVYGGKSLVREPGRAKGGEPLPASSNWPAVLAILVATAFAGLGAYSSKASGERLDSQQARERTLEEDRHLVSALQLAFAQVDTGTKGFASTGDEAQLQPYLQAAERIPGISAELQSRITSHTRLQFSWRDLDELRTARALAASAVVELRRTQGGRVTARPDLFESGNALGSKLDFQLKMLDLQLVREIQRVERGMQSERQEVTRLQTLAAFAIAVLLVAALGFWFYERSKRLKLLAELAHSNATLESRVQDRTQALVQANQKIREFSYEAQHLVDVERKRLSREVHDQIGQIFTGIKMIAHSLKSDVLDKGQYAAMLDAIDGGVKTSRRIAAELRPPPAR